MRIVNRIRKMPSPDEQPSTGTIPRDRGAIATWFAVLVVVILGSGAIVIDYGALVHERRQLQNGADAAALAVAIDCANSRCDVAGPPTQRAQTYANANASDGAANVDVVCGVGPGLTTCPAELVPPGATQYGRYVRVITSTLNPRNTRHPDRVRYLLAPLLDAAQVGRTVRASSSVGWGTLSSANVLPLAISKCMFNPAWIGADGSVNFPNTPIRIDINNSGTCAQGWPNGFDYTSDPTGNCTESPLTINNGVILIPSNSEGNNPRCPAVIQDRYRAGVTLIVPMMYARVGSGGGTTIYADGFAALRLCGYALGGGFLETSCPTVCPTNQPSQTRLCGTFRAITTTQGVVGNGNVDYGSRVSVVFE
jgi:hypothetical protein